MNTFSPTEAIKFGWNTFKANPGFLIGLLVIVYVVQFALGFVVNLFPSDNSANSAVVMILGLVTNVISIILSLGMINALLKLVNTGKGNFSDIFSEFTNFKLLVNYIVGSILVGLMVIGGFLLLIIPGIYLAIRLGQFPYFIVDKNLGTIEAIKASWNATRGNVINLMVLGFLSFLVGVAGFLALLVGLLVALPVISVAAIYVYKMLSQQSAPAATPVAPTPVPPAPIAPPAMPAT